MQRSANLKPERVISLQLSAITCGGSLIVDSISRAQSYGETRIEKHVPTKVVTYRTIKNLAAATLMTRS